MLTLSLLRHAKAADGSGVADHDRPLTTAGIAQAQALRQWLQQQGMSFDLALCSTALRAQQTADEALVEVCNLRENIRSIYHATVPDLLQLLAASAGESKRVVIVGHNPTISMMAGWLGGFAGAYHPCTLTHYHLAAPSWEQLKQGCGQLQARFQAE